MLVVDYTIQFQIHLTPSEDGEVLNTFSIMLTTWP
jgi:hypothetical protein